MPETLTREEGNQAMWITLNMTREGPIYDALCRVAHEQVKRNFQEWGDDLQERIADQLEAALRALWDVTDRLQDILQGREPEPESPLGQILDRLDQLERTVYGQ